MAISDTHVDSLTGMTLKERILLERAPRLPGYKQPWNPIAKGVRAHQIGVEERARIKALARQRGLGIQNNELDALRHAEWSRRMAAEIDPITAFLAGEAVEISRSVLGRQPRAEAEMDRFNNAEGRRAAAEGRRVDPRNLQSDPYGVRPASNPFRIPPPARPAPLR